MFALKQISVQSPGAAGQTLRIGYREAGTGPAILALHGVGSSSQSFALQVEALSARFRVIAWDAPGYGGSDDYTGEPSPGAYADIAVALLDALKIDTAHIVGHSMGGLIAAALVARHATRVSRVVLSSCASGYALMSQTEREERLANPCAPRPVAPSRCNPTTARDASCPPSSLGAKRSSSTTRMSRPTRSASSSIHRSISACLPTTATAQHDRFA